MQFVMGTIEAIDQDFYDTVDISLLCRICCKPSNIPLIPVFDGGISLNDLADKIKSYLPIIVLPHDLLPTKICFKCATSVVVWHEFFECCLTTDKKLRSILAKREIHYEKVENTSSDNSLQHDAPNETDRLSLGNSPKAAVEKIYEVQVKQEIEENGNLALTTYNKEHLQDLSQFSEPTTETANSNTAETEEEESYQDENKLMLIREINDFVGLEKEDYFTTQESKSPRSESYKKESFQKKAIGKNGKTRKRPVLYHRTSLEQKKILIKQIYEEGKTIAEAAIVAGVNKNTAKNLVKTYRDDGEEIIQRQWGRKNNTKLTITILNKIEEMIEDNPSLTLRNMRKLLGEENIHISTSTIHNGLKDLKITLKLDRFNAGNMNVSQSKEERRLHAKNFLKNFPSNISKCIFIDECGFNLYQGKPMRIKSGKRSADSMISPLVKGRHVTLIAAMNNQGIIHNKVLSNGICSAIKFCDFIKELKDLIAHQENMHDSWIIVDNAAIHSTNDVKQLLAETNMQLKFLPWYSSTINPLEGVFKKVKVLARAILNNPMLNQTLLEVVKESVESVTMEDCASFVGNMMSEVTKIAEEHSVE